MELVNIALIITRVAENSYDAFYAQYKNVVILTQLYKFGDACND